MKIGIISDTHDNIWNLKKALNKLQEQGIDILIHCGDLCTHFIIPILDKLNLPVYVVFGNIDDKKGVQNMSSEAKNVTHYGDVGEITIDGKNIAFTHKPADAEKLAQTGKYDVVFHGHTHTMRDNKIGTTKIINPGEIIGRKGNPSYAIYDTTTDKVEFFEFRQHL